MIYHQIFNIGLILVLKGALSAGELTQRLIASTDVCPESEPDGYSACSPLLANVTCDYGQICCEGDGKCVPERSCYCDGSTYFCYDPGVSLSCPSACPVEPPLMNEACDIDYRYQCNYGDAVVCDVPGYSSEFEQQCSCYGGSFHCFSFTCPVPCPATQPVEGDACSAAFVNDVCNYGTLCCGDEKDGACIPDKTCYCDGSTISCYGGGGSLTCPEVCPTEPPKTNDSCEIDDRFLCEYGNAFVCEDSDYSFDYEKQCSCYNGTFYCNSFACPTPCPETQPVEGDDCSPFVDFSCNYGEVCCPDGEGECVANKTCYCDESTMKVACYEPTTWCPSSCPATKPVDGAACAISDRFTCEYATGACSADDAQLLDSSCSCKFGSFVCYTYCSSSSSSSSAEEVIIYDDFMFNGEQPPAQAPVPNAVVEELPSDSPSQSPTINSDAQQDDNDSGHHGKNGKMKDKKKKNATGRTLGAARGGN